MNCYVSICEDYAQLVADFPGILEEDALGRSLLSNWSGHNTYHNDNKSIKVLTSIEGFSFLADQPYITVTTYEAIFGISGTLPDPVMRALYNSVYDQTPVDIDGVTHTPPKLVAVPSGWDYSHLTL